MGAGRQGRHAGHGAEPQRAGATAVTASSTTRVSSRPRGPSSAASSTTATASCWRRAGRPRSRPTRRHVRARPVCRRRRRASQARRAAIPLGGVAFSVLGDWAGQVNWGARNSSYVERDSDTTLKGFDDRQRLVDVVHPRTGARERTIRRDYSALLPIVRHGADSTRPEVALLLGRPRDVHLSLDARLQQRVARGAACGHRARRTRPRRRRRARRRERRRAGLGQLSRVPSRRLPPATTTRAATRCSIACATASIRRDRPSSCSSRRRRCAAHPELQAATHLCVRLPGGRVGNSIRGWARPVRDDITDASPHGAVDLHRGLVVSCNAYFAQLAMQLGPRPLLDAVSMFQIDVARPSTVAALRGTLPHAGYGQGDVLASPLKMARVVAAIAGDGRVRPVRWTPDADDAREDGPALPGRGRCAASGARTCARW